MAASIRCRINLFCRTVCLSDKRHFSHGLSLQSYLDKSKTMRKILNKANKKKYKLDGPIYNTNVEITSGMQGPMRAGRQFSEGMKRRAGYLSEVLYEAVNQIIVCGELGVTPTILKVEVLPDCSHMNIYWEASGIKEEDQQTQIELDTKAKKLRHFLIQSHVLGQVPRPVFVADMQTARQRQVDEILRTIAIEDKKAISSSTENTSEIDFDGESDNDVADSVSDNHFRQDLYGVPHDAFMQKIVSLKSSASQRPAVTPHSEDDAMLYPRLNLKETKKYFKVKKPPSRKKMMLAAEREFYNESVVDTSNMTWPEKHDSGYESDYKEDNSSLDDYINTLEEDDDRNSGHKET